MVKHLKYLGILSLLCFSFFYTEKIAKFMQSKDPLYVSIETVKEDYKQDYVNAIIDEDNIIPGLNGKEIDVQKSFQKMQDYGYFSESHIVYAKINPEISLENNTTKIIKQGNTLKHAVSLITQSVLHTTYLGEIGIPYSVLVTSSNAQSTFYNGIKINFDKEDYEGTEKILNREKNNLCVIKNNFNDICLKYKKKMIEPTLSFSNGNMASQFKMVSSGMILYLEDDLDVSNLKVLLNEINFKGLKIISLDELISEER